MQTGDHPGDADVAIVAQLTSDRSLLSSESAALAAAVETNGFLSKRHYCGVFT